MKNFVKRSMLLLALMLVSTTGFAQTKVVVIPMSGADLKPLNNIVTVAKENGDFDNLNSALASITDASANNPYLLVIAPGKYTLSAQAVIPEYVQVSGSGRDVTILQAASGTNALEEAAAAIVLPNNAVISDLTLKSGASNSHVIGIYLTKRGSSDKSAIIDNVYVDALYSSASLWNVGIYDREGDAEINNSVIKLQKTVATGLSQAGVYIYNSYTKMNNLDINVKSTSDGLHYGIYVEALGNEYVQLRESNVYARTTAVFNLDNARPVVIKGSKVRGNTDAVDGHAAISYSSLNGGMGGGAQRCVAADNGGTQFTLAALDSSCMPIP